LTLYCSGRRIQHPSRFLIRIQGRFHGIFDGKL
jgi:hypothetical protein